MNIGILGSGQLARMLSIAAQTLGIDTVCFSPMRHDSATRLSQTIHGEYHDQEKLQQLVNQVDLITYENENIPIKAAQFCIQKSQLYPPYEALKVSQDRLLEKNLFAQLNIPTVQYIAIDSYQRLKQAVAQLGTPALLKTRRFGYDGKGQVPINNVQDLEKLCGLTQEEDLILEKYIHFDRELSIIAVRSFNGQIKFYPLTLNYHQKQILRLSIAPFESPLLQQQAQQYAKALLEHLNYIGVIAIEFFLVNDTLIANEFAPRVHNSGHWTIDGSYCSQFENHIRSISKLPLGDTEAAGYNAMINCISSMPDRNEILKLPCTHYYDYQKQARPGRKLGHINLHNSNKKTFYDLLQRLCQQFGLEQVLETLRQSN